MQELGRVATSWVSLSGPRCSGAEGHRVQRATGCRGPQGAEGKRGKGRPGQMGIPTERLCQAIDSPVVGGNWDIFLKNKDNNSPNKY